MLEIDYDLIPLDATAQRQIARDAELLARRGKVPPLSQSNFGRVAVVNPNQGFDLHHVPDDLRKPLRRMFVPVFQGALPIHGKALIDAVHQGSDEELYALVLELHSEFPTLLEFLRYLPDLHSRHPRCQLILHADVLHFYNLLEAVIGEEGVSVELGFDYEPKPVRVHTLQALGNVLVDLPRYPTFNTPVFEALKLNVGGTSEWYTPPQLRRLYRQFGVGNVEELDLQGKLRDKLIVVDLPFAAIEAVRFAGGDSGTFRAARLGGEKFFAVQFAEKGVLGRDVPLADVEALFRMLPGKDEEEFNLAAYRGLRVNCFEEHVSLLTRPTQAFIPLYEVKRLRIVWRATSVEDGAAPTAAGPAPEGQVLELDRVVATEEGRPRFGEVRASIRRGYLGRLYRDNLEHQAKLLGFTRRINVACLGPLAAQTFKLLRLYGLEKIISSDTLYYLCDDIGGIQGYANLREGFRRMYQEVLQRLKAIMDGQAGNGLHAEIITHRLPVVHAWARDEAPPFEQVGADDLDAVYRELQVFIKFCEHEFLRLEQGESSSAARYEALSTAQATAIMTRQLQNLLGGRYGHFFTGDTQPDFVFFGTEREFQENARRYHLPGLSWSTVFSNPTLQGLYEQQDYDFAVFLEEQLGAMRYLRTQEDAAQADTFAERYFRGRMDEVSDELRLLEERVRRADDRTSAIYQGLRDSFVKEHAEELATFARESEQVGRNLEQQEQDYFEALGRVTASLGDAALAPETLLADGDYISVLDRHLVQHAEGVVARLRDVLQRSGALADRFLRAKLPLLKDFLLTYRDVRQAQFDLLRQEFLDGVRAEHERVRPRIVEALRALQKMKVESAGTLEANLLKRRRTALQALEEVKAQMSKVVSDSQMEIAALRDSVRNISRALVAPRADDGNGAAPGEPAALVETMQARMNRAAEDIAQVVNTIDTARQSMDSYRLLYRKQRERMVELYAADNQLALLERFKDAALARTARGTPIDAPLLPQPRVSAGGGAETRRARMDELAATLAGIGHKLGDFGKKESFLREARARLQEYEEFRALQQRFQHAVTRKQRGQRAVINIARRLDTLGQEARQLQALIDGQMIPSYKIVCERVYIPNARKRIDHFRQALTFAQELERLSFDELKARFMERAIFKRFYTTQFRAGAYFGMNPSMPLYAKLTNLFPALGAFHDRVRTHLTRLDYDPKAVTLTKLPTTRTGAIIEFCEEQQRAPLDKRLSYLVLPGTLSLPQALDIIQKKDVIFMGLPELVLVFISRFNPRAIHDDEALREQYFRAVKHNIIVNIDDGHLIDNPDAIANRLLDETLGCACDFPPQALARHAPATREGPAA
ncbi:MAG: hypothetical protein HY342_00435 [Candidatus Lambdaproteobacteria bacterium]|nr:hypothetical protein [Candidatus Lambdaproteobacteria bacterium]